MTSRRAYLVFFLFALVLVNVGQVAGRKPPAQKARTHSLLAERSNNEYGVLIDVTVADRRGRDVATLEATDFRVWEDGKPQRLRGMYQVSDPVKGVRRTIYRLYYEPSNQRMDDSRRRVVIGFRRDMRSGLRLSYSPNTYIAHDSRLAPAKSAPN